MARAETEALCRTTEGSAGVRWIPRSGGSRPEGLQPQRTNRLRLPRSHLPKCQTRTIDRVLPLRTGLCIGADRHNRSSLHHAGMGIAQLPECGVRHQEAAPHPLPCRLCLLQRPTRRPPQPQVAVRLRCLPHLRRGTPPGAGGTGSRRRTLAAGDLPDRWRKVTHLPAAGSYGRALGPRTHGGDLTPAVADEGPGG